MLFNAFSARVVVRAFACLLSIAAFDAATTSPSFGNFRDVAVGCPAGAINNIVFADPNGQSVAALNRDNSLGQVSLSGDVVGPYTIPVASTDPCNLSGMTSAVQAAATSAGVNLAAYTHQVLVMPQNTCGATGFGTVGGSPSLAWIFICDSDGNYAHELGHNLGMDHTSTPDFEYGDVVQSLLGRIAVTRSSSLGVRPSNTRRTPRSVF